MTFVKLSDLIDRVLNEWEAQRVKDEAWASDPARVYTLPDHPTWEQVAARQPAIDALLDVAARFGRQDHDSYESWSRFVKPQITQLVGWEADVPPPLRTSAVYDVVYARLLGIYEGREAAA